MKKRVFIIIIIFIITLISIKVYNHYRIKGILKKDVYSKLEKVKFKEDVIEEFGKPKFILTSTDYKHIPDSLIKYEYVYILKLLPFTEIAFESIDIYLTINKNSNLVVNYSVIRD